MPFGDEITSPQTSNDRVKFATYTRDSYTGLDYADQRFYASTYGRFNIPDPFGGSIHNGNPQSWNRYSYTLGDPINGNDPTGQDLETDGNPNICDMIGYGDNTCQAAIANAGGGGGGGGYLTNFYSGSSDPNATGLGLYETTTVNYDGGGSETDSSYETLNPSGNNAATSSSIWSGSVTGNLGWLGAMIGGLLGPEGILPGALIGSMCGFGPSASYVPSTGSLYGGIVLSCGVLPLQGGGISGSAVSVPGTQNPNQIANGPSGSVTYLPTGGFPGSTIVKSPGSGPAVIGIALGNRAPVSGSIGVNICIRRCTTP
jgi:RHS repeat-associated protein